jgi:predicted nucleic acid-binding protein
MKRLLLDTNVASEVRKHKPHGAVVAWLTDLQEDQIFISAVTLGELQAGIEMTRRQDAAKAKEIEQWGQSTGGVVPDPPDGFRCFS